MAEQVMFRDRVTHAGLKVSEGKATDLITGQTRPAAEIDQTKYEKVNLLTKLRDVIQGIKQHGLGSLTKIE